MNIDVLRFDLNDYLHGDCRSTYIPGGYDLVEYEDGTDPLDGIVLFGFDEVGLTAVPNAKYAFIKLAE